MNRGRGKDNQDLLQNIPEYLLPEDTRRNIDGLFNGDLQGKPKYLFINSLIENKNLLLYKYARFLKNRNREFKLFITSKNEVQHDLSLQYDREFLGEVAAKQKKAIDGLNQETDSLKLRLAWRMIVGLGRESVYETGISLHHVYGIPYIPGQAIKGMLRNFLIQNYREKVNENDIKLLFGTQEQTGRLLFFDAFPSGESRITIKKDIMNPHYAAYYAKGGFPADYSDPKPIYFLTVENAVFTFYIGFDSKKNGDAAKKGMEIFGDPNLLAGTKELLHIALTEYGIGAKTSLGYGLFTDV